jgi:coenzyme F420-reducing hydrogenase delta subunit
MKQYKVTVTKIYLDGELCTYEYDHANYSDAVDTFDETLSRIHVDCSIAKVMTVSISEGTRVIKQVTSSFINNI